MSADYKEISDDSKARRARNREQSPQRLKEAGIEYRAADPYGAHLIVGEWDFWPGTGLWCWRKDRAIRGRGVHNLINRIQRQP